MRDGIPVSTLPWTLLDLAASLPQRALERAIAQADIQHLLDLSSLDALVGAHRRRPGAARLRQALRAPAARTRSELEEHLLAICREHHLPIPHTNAHVEGLEVDFLFAAARLVVETDGWAFHRTRRAFERDRERDAALTRAGYTTLRLTHRQLRNPDRTAATVAAALRLASSTA